MGLTECETGSYSVCADLSLHCLAFMGTSHCKIFACVNNFVYTLKISQPFLDKRASGVETHRDCEHQRIR